MCSLDIEIYFTKTLIFKINGKRNESILHWSKRAINCRFYKNRVQCGKLGPNPSAKKGSVHFLLGALLPCSTPFCTSGLQSHFFSNTFPVQFQSFESVGLPSRGRVLLHNAIRMSLATPTKI